MKAISNSHGAGVTKFGPNTKQYQDAEVDWFSIRLYTNNGEKVPGVCRVHKDYIKECTVELGVGSFKDFDNQKTPAMTCKVSYTAARSEILGVWAKLIANYEYSK